MKNFVKLAVVASAAALCLVACAKKQQPQTEPEAEPAPAAVAPAAEPNADSLAAEQARLEAERLAAERARLEAERARLEALINQIMSEDVYFDFDRSELTEKAKELLAQVGELLIKEERFTITIEGHTDARGTEDYNFTLGAKRAMKVKEFLVAYGIDAKRMESVSYGKEAPKVEGATEEAYSQNRRANFRVNIKE
ncbi:MAG: OmpA family protein [Fibrobacter sp.]|jgi:peptidoglycan-associated lipoprotein|uniref:OmpA family protein n=1 Tax=Fibrobacter sp. UWT2 TaxID=1896224 RepID=UPI0009172E68|nr:OmpA family protein [Fibrobacter sp. UWT2]MBR2271397.1 OmpA family protein [Fibrobacter sp.]MBR4681573.1 OmpA family protein [Fibrobacter sp.]MBR6831906.1 OmpA family protein [Fibrobacter sp.]SHK32440.1 peptidoglycan-associated lipoprotein [Fibrobacter sp. UWT2]